MSQWEVEITDQFRQWYLSLTDSQQQAITERVEHLETTGPMTRRPYVGEVAGAKVHNLKELRVSTLRILFAFDPRQTAILLVGGDKATGGWKGWYRTAIAEAVDLYEAHLAELDAEGLL
jgi:hypothetical protein